MGDYIADRVTTTSRFEKVLELEFPTITICMDPPQKLSVAQMYGFNSMAEIHWTDVPNTTLSERFETSSYILNKDFSINVHSKSFGNKEVELMIGENDDFLVEPIVTYFQGICYKIEPKFKVTNFTYFTFKWHLKEKSTDNPSYVLVYLTSPDATLNLATDIWPQYLPGEIKLAIDDITKKTAIKYRAVEYTFKTGTENSSQCVTEIMENSICKSSCFYISGSSFPICNSTKDFACLWSYFEQWQECLLQKHAVAYVVKKNEIQLYANNSTEIELRVGAFSKSKQIREEVDVITLSGLIGSVGGSLGMFFGFSITSYISFVIESFIKKVFYKN